MRRFTRLITYLLVVIYMAHGPFLAPSTIGTFHSEPDCQFAGRTVTSKLPGSSFVCVKDGVFK